MGITSARRFLAMTRQPRRGERQRACMCADNGTTSGTLGRMPASGDLLAGRYRILAPLGAGGMATVYRANDERLSREVAIKILLPNLATDPVVAERFAREARTLAAAAHPGVV